MFLDHHGNTDAEAYVLTIMNMVSDFYHDSSVGNMIDVVIVRIIMLEKEKREVDLAISRNAETTLKSFAAWAKRTNPTGHDHPNHHDIAVLVTRHDICSDNMTQCGLLGLAYVAAACNPPLASCINEDTGLVLSVTVTHEVGHVMGCSHDTEEISGCKPVAADGSGHVMSPYVKAHTTLWSTCSRKFITEFLDNGLGECLLDQPKDQLFKLPSMPVGAMYDATYQCKTLFGPTSKQCSETVDCTALWCVNKPNSCSSYGDPPADGTKCAANKWCYNLECVPMGKRPGAVNGGWGSWSAWGSCSRTCGGGVASKERQCDNPAPKHLGRYCVGKRKQYRTCNTMPCSLTAPGFREVQCTERNAKPFNGKLYKWKPYAKEGGNPCALTCINEQHVYAVLDPRVKDGTPCKPGTKDICCGGVCKHVGCDWQLESGNEFDQCGICKGDGTQCDHIEGKYWKNGNGYVKVVTIPKGAHNVNIRELKAIGDTIAVSDSKGSKFYLNGKNTEQLDGQYMFGKSTLGVYSHPEKDREELVIFGPTEEELILYVAFYKREKYPGLHYDWYTKKTRRQASAPPKYNWEFVEWGECSVRCGGGSEIALPCCVENNGGKVSNTFCQELQKPEAISRVCNQDPCPSRWVAGKWSKCKSGRRTREIKCMMEAPHVSDDDIEVSDDHCHGTKPESNGTCTEHSHKHSKPITTPFSLTTPSSETTPCSLTTPSSETTPCSFTMPFSVMTPCPKSLDAIRSQVMDVIDQLSNIGEKPLSELKGKYRQQVSAASGRPSNDFKDKFSQELASNVYEKHPMDLNEHNDMEALRKGDEPTFGNLKDAKESQQLFSIEDKGIPMDLQKKEEEEERNKLLALYGLDLQPTDSKDENNGLHSLEEEEKHPSDSQDDTIGLEGILNEEDGEPTNLKEKKNVNSIVRDEKDDIALKEEKENPFWEVEEQPANIKEIKDFESETMKGENPLLGSDKEQDITQQLSIEDDSFPAELKEEKHNLQWLKDDTDNIPHSIVAREKQSIDLRNDKDNLKSFTSEITHSVGLEENHNNTRSLKAKGKHHTHLKGHKIKMHSLASGEKHPTDLQDDKENVMHSLVAKEKHHMLSKDESDNLHSLVAGEKHNMALKDDTDSVNSLDAGRKHSMGLKNDKDSLIAHEKHSTELEDDKDKLNSLVAGGKHSMGLKNDKDSLKSLVEGEKHSIGLKNDNDSLNSLVAGEKQPIGLKNEKDSLNSLVTEGKHPMELKDDKDSLNSFVAGEKHPMGLKNDKDSLNSLVTEGKHVMGLKDDKDSLNSLVAGEKHPVGLKNDKDDLQSLVAGEKHPMNLKGDKDNLHSLVAGEKHPLYFKYDEDSLHSSTGGGKHPMDFKDDSKDFEWEQWLKGQSPSDSKEKLVPQELSGPSGENEGTPQTMVDIDDENRGTDFKNKKYTRKLSSHHKHKHSEKGGKRKSKGTYSRHHHHGSKVHGNSKLYHHRTLHNRKKKHHHHHHHHHKKHARLDRHVTPHCGPSEDDDENDNEEDLDMTTPGCSQKKKDHKLQQNEEVEDRRPAEAVVLLEVPTLEPNKTSGCNGTNVLSEEAEEEMGDPESVMLDTNHEKVYRGKEAINKIKEIENQAQGAQDQGQETTSSSCGS